MPEREYVVRRVTAQDWRDVRALRLEALQDPVAPMAYLETYADAVARPDAFYQDRAAGASAGEQTAQYVAIADGRWIASVTGLHERPGTQDWAGDPIEHRQAHVVGVWVHPDHRGAGLLGRLVDEVATWAAAYDAERLRLLVHERNARAQAAYRKIGFAPTGRLVQLADGTEVEMSRPL